MKTKIISAVSIVAVTAMGMVDEVRADEKSGPTYSFNVAVTSDYIFRGFSQTARAATGQAGADVTWGKFYAGVWASGLDFGTDPLSGNKANARAEVDLYAGIKPVWNNINFDFGVIYYAYPGARDNGNPLVGETNYVELKAGMSRELWKDATWSSTLFFSPDYTFSTGRVFTTESQFSQVLPQIAGWTPTFSALLGSQYGRDASYATIVGNGEKKYMYWNAGVAFGWEKFTIDLRYWDTNIKDDAAAPNFCTSTVFQCDQRFVGTVKFTY